jgi:ribosomal-protein-alanine N-acetyltransferase
LTLECRVSNQIAQKLYRKFGFKVVGRRKQYYSDNKEDAFIMTTDLINTVDYEEMFDELREKHSQKWGLRPRYLES